MRHNAQLVICYLMRVYCFCSGRAYRLAKVSLFFYRFFSALNFVQNFLEPRRRPQEGVGLQNKVQQAVQNYLNEIYQRSQPSESQGFLPPTHYRPQVEKRKQEIRTTPYCKFHQSLQGLSLKIALKRSDEFLVQFELIALH